jgi:putative transposase
MVSSRRSYPSDLTDKEWHILKKMIPEPLPGSRPRSTNMREFLNTIFYVIKSGCSWRMVPNDLVTWGTSYDYFRKWCKDGTWEKINTALHKKTRLASGREEEPSAVCIDSQSFKTTSKEGSVDMMEIRKSRIVKDI